jgi:RNA recognition motif-containing protein
MESVGGPDAKKARWSPTSFNGTNANGGLNTSANSGVNNATRDAFANYGYGPHASISQSFQPNSSPAFTPNALYSTPSLSINTGINGQGMQMNPQMSPHTGVAFAQQQQQVGQQGHANGGNPYGNAGAFGYGMLGMGLPSVGMMGGFPYSSHSGNFAQNFSQQHRLPSLNVNIPPTPGAYSPAALSAVISGTPNTTARTVYVGNLPSTASVDELLNLVHFGPLESIRVLPEKSCVFLSFLDGQTAASFHADATIKKLSLHGQELKIGWGKPSPVPAQVQLAIQQSNASRNVYLGGLDEGMTEEMLRDELSRFGLIDQVKIVRDKNIGFVHFLSISVATKVVNTLPTEPVWAGKRVNYGKDRCAYIPKSQQAAAQAAQAAAAQSLVAQSATMSPNSGNPFGGPNPFGSPYSPYSPFTPEAMGLGPGAGGMQGLNRTVYMGNIHPETTTEDLCNAIRGGVLQSVRYMQDKHIAFVTFVDPAAAFTFFQVSSYQGLTLNNRRLKIGWGKNSGPLPPSLALAVHSGATRNVYVGNIEDFELFNEDKFKRDFGEFGDIELVNFLKEKNCAFVNFTNVSNAIKAIDGVKNKPDYANLRIAHGKDRCANPPRSGPQGGSSRRTTSGNGASADANEGVEGGDEDEDDEEGVAYVVKEEDGVAGPGPEDLEMRIDSAIKHEDANGN